MLLRVPLLEAYFCFHEFDRQNMVATYDADRNNRRTAEPYNRRSSKDKGKDEKDVVTVSVTTGYTNKGFKGDNDHELTKPPVEPVEDETIPKGKFKLSRKEKWRILKNIAAVSLAFMVQFTAFQGTANLQSSINAKEGLGTVSLSAIYAALVVSCIFVPTFVIRRLTVKWTLCLSLLCYAPYIAAQFYPRFYTLVPAGVLVGLGAAPMWAAKATYLTQVGAIYAKLTDQPVDGIIVRFFGFFFLAWQTSELWGNLISSLVLSGGAHGGGHDHNMTVSEEALRSCGSNFCVLGNKGLQNLNRPPDSEIYEISSIYLACIVLASIMVALFVDPLSRYGENRKKTGANELNGIQMLSATAYQLKKPYQQLLIPITVWIGMEQAFIGADFTQAYVACALVTFLKMERHLLPIKAHYFLYFGGMGPLYPFIPIIIRNMGFSDTIVGVIFLWLPICGMVAKTWFGALADKYKKQRFFFLLFIFLSLAFAFCILLLPSSSKKPSVTLECASTGTNFHFCSASQLPENEKQQFLSQNLTNIPCHLICQNNDKASFSLADELCKSWGVPDFCNSQELRGIGEDYNLLSNEARPKSSNNLKSFRFEFSTFVSTNSSHAMQGCMYFPLGRAVFRSTQTESLHCSQAQTIICDMNCENGALKELWIQSMSRTKINDNDAFTMPLFWLLFVTLICVQSSVAVVVIMGDAICFQLLGDKPEGFGGQRLWASVGWGILSILSGHLVDLLNEGKEHRNYDILIYLSIGMFALDFFAAYNIKCTQTNVSMNIFKDLTKLLSQFRIVVFVAWCIVTGIFSALLWNFLFLYIEDLAAEQGSGNTQWTKTLTGLIIGVQSLGGEVPFFFLSESILKKLGHIHTMSVVLASFILRFSLISLVINPWYILPIELLNGVTYGLLTSAMNSYASIVAPPGTEATTQGLVGAIFEGIGTSIGSYICGNLFDFYGGRTVFRIFSVAAAGAFVFHVIIQYAIQLKVRLKSGKNLGKPDTNGVKNETLQMQ